MIFAQALPPTEIAAFLACVVFVIAALNGGWKLIDRWKGKPPPDEILERIDKKFATKTMVEGVQGQIRSVEMRVADLDDEIQEGLKDQTISIESKIEKSRQERQHEMGGIYEKINRVAESVAGLSAKVETGNQHQVHIEGKLDRLIEHRRPR